MRNAVWSLLPSSIKITSHPPCTHELKFCSKTGNNLGKTCSSLYAGIITENSTSLASKCSIQLAYCIIMGGTSPKSLNTANRATSVSEGASLLSFFLSSRDLLAGRYVWSGQAGMADCTISRRSVQRQLYFWSEWRDDLVLFLPFCCGVFALLRFEAIILDDLGYVQQSREEV